jgi:hypothetical protein
LALGKSSRWGLKGYPWGDLGTQLLLSAPVFLLYHLGLLLGPRAANGVDPITRLLAWLVGMSWIGYLGVMLGLALVYVAVLHRMRRNGRLGPEKFVQVVLESSLYALIMGPAANLILHQVHLIGVFAQMGPVERIVASAGAGFYEELVFRLLGVFLLSGLFHFLGFSRRPAVWLSVAVCAVVFSAFHYIGSQSDVFQLASFSFRFLLGVMLGAILVLRGFATAVYSHFVYDVYVMLFVLA